MTQKIVRVKLKAETKSYKNEMRRASRSVNTFGKQLKKVAGMVAGAFAVSSVVSFASASVKAYDVQAKSEAELLTALKGRKSAQQDLINQAQQLQKVTLFGDEETIHAQALIAAFVKEKDQIKQIIPLVQDFATAKKMNLAAAADLVSKTLGSTTNALTRYGIKVEGAVGSNERLQSTIKGLSNAFKGQAQAAALAGTGGLKQLMNMWGDMKEKIGGLIYQGLKPFVGVMKELMTPSQDLVGSLQKEKEQANLLAIQLTNTNISAKERNTIYQTLKTHYPDILKGINQEKIDVKKLAENLDHYNSSMVKKIMMEQQNQKLNKLLRKEGEAKSRRAKSELDLSKALLNNLPEFARWDAVRAKKAKEILGSSEDIFTKYKQIGELVGKSQLENKYATAGLDWGKIDNMAWDVVDARKAEAKATKDSKKQSEENLAIYRKAFGLGKESVQLTLEQRNEIDEYNRVLGKSLDYSKALTEEQKKQLAKAKGEGFKETLISLQKMQDNLADLKTKRDELRGTLIDPNAIPKNVVGQINALNKQIATLEKRIKTVNALMPPASPSETPITPMAPKAIKFNIADNITPQLAESTAGLNGFKKTALDVSNAVNSSMQGMVFGITDSFAALLSGAAPVGEFFNTILLVIAQFMKQLGEAIIATAVASAAFKKLILAHPIAAIAAGIALVAASALVTRALKKGPGMIEGGVVPPGYPNDGYNARLTSGEVVVPPKKLEVFLGDIAKNFKKVQENQNKNITTNATNSIFNSEIIKNFRNAINKNITNNPVTSVFNNGISKSVQENQNKNITTNSVSSVFNALMQKINPPNLNSRMALALPGAQNLKLNAIPIEVKVSGMFKQRGNDLVAVVEQTQINRKRIRGY